MNKQNSKQYFWYVIGIVFLSLGISLTIQSQLGTSPFDALLIGLSKEIGLTVGSWEVIIAFIIIICNSLLNKSRLEFLGLVSAILTGIGIDLWLFLLEKFIYPEIWIGKLICFTVGIVLSGFGTSIYLQTKFTPIPLDQFMLTIQSLTKTNILLARTLIYLLFLLLSFIFNGPIGLGTMLTVLLGGPILSYLMPIMKRIISNSYVNKEGIAK